VNRETEYVDFGKSSRNCSLDTAYQELNKAVGVSTLRIYIYIYRFLKENPSLKVSSCCKESIPIFFQFFHLFVMMGIILFSSSADTPCSLKKKKKKKWRRRSCDATSCTRTSCLTNIIGSETSICKTLSVLRLLSAQNSSSSSSSSSSSWRYWQN